MCSQKPDEPTTTESAPQRSAGRPRKLDEAAQREICALISVGCGVRAAARYVDCAPSTIRREAQRNPQFKLALRRAFQSPILRAINTLHDASGRNWRAAAWLLEHENPHVYGRSPRKGLDPEAITRWFNKLTDIILEEVREPEARQRISRTLAKLTIEDRQPRRSSECEQFLRACRTDSKPA